MVPFRQKFPLESRLRWAENAKQYENHVPVVLENFKDGFYRKLLVEKSTTLSGFIYEIKKREDIKSAVYLIINGSIPPTRESVEFMFDKHKDPDGLLYVEMRYENMFG